MRLIEYRVRPVTRFIVTRFERSVSEAGVSGGSSQLGEYECVDNAYDVAYALCKAEHERLGYPIGDERIQYPQMPRSLVI